jgi:adenylosuccinate synthase
MSAYQVRVITDLQYGSTGKGLIAGVLAKRDRVDTVVTAWAANAGHTFIDSGGRKFVHTMLANGVVSPSLQRVLIGPGSVIDPVNLLREINDCRDLLGGVDILIHPHAAVITQEHRDREAGPMTKIGSTKKGVGEAAIQRIRRDPANQNIAATSIGPELDPFVCTPIEYRNALDAARMVQVEGAQGFSLSMYHGFYPYCTSRDVTPAQILADCGIPVHWLTHVTGTLRTFPIRVANRYGEDGTMTGWSGPCYDDQYEMSWDQLGRSAELTTVTKLPRRLFSFSLKQLHDAVWQTGADELFLNFVNYLPSREAIAAMIGAINTALVDLPAAFSNEPRIVWVGDGATELDVHYLPGNKDWTDATAQDYATVGVRSAQEEAACG